MSGKVTHGGAWRVRKVWSLRSGETASVLWCNA
jgi:hypothetical protein